MVILYSTPTCPKCKVLESKLQMKGIQYQKCMDIEEMEKLGIMSVPILGVKGQLLNFAQAANWINAQGEQT